MLNNDFSITKLFCTKEINIYIDDKTIHFKAKTIRDICEDKEWGRFYEIVTLGMAKFKELLPNKEMENEYDYIKLLIFTLGKYKEYSNIASLLKDQLSGLFKDHVVVFDYHNDQISIDDIIITSEIWSYIIGVINLTYGSAKDLPQTFATPEAKALWLKQKALEDKINSVKSKKEPDPDAIIKVLLSITYSFPSFTFDYLLDQTLAQIHWLRNLAAKQVSYSVQEKACAAGNMKRGSNLEFFIK